MDSSSQKNSFNRGRSPFHYIQIHLSTAVVLMFVAAVLVGLNSIPKVFQRPEEWGGGELWCYGWPYVVYMNYHNSVSGDPSWFYKNGFWNVVIFFPVLTILCIGLEWRIRRRSKQMTNDM